MCSTSRSATASSILTVVILLAGCGSGNEVSGDIAGQDLSRPGDVANGDGPGVGDIPAHGENVGDDWGAETSPLRLDSALPDETADKCPWLAEAEPPVQHGVAYIAHFLSTELKVVRTDGAAPLLDHSVEMGAYSHDLALDPYNGLLFLVQDTVKKVQILRGHIPDNIAAPVAEPDTLAVLDFGGDIPLFAAVDPLRHSLFVAASPPPDGELLTFMKLYRYDISQPESPQQIGEPVETAVTTTMAVDPLAGILFLIGLKDHKLYLYDIAGGTELLPGTPPLLTDYYPQENNMSFQARNLHLDPWRGRLLLARSQGAFSEVMAFDYPPAVPGAPGECPARPDYDSLLKVDDFFDIDTPVEDRPNLLDGFVAMPDLTAGHTFLLAAAWNGKASSAIVVPMSQELNVAAGCKAFEGFGCWLRAFMNGIAGAHLNTDGAACLDSTHSVVVATSISDFADGAPGSIHFFHWQDGLTMSKWLTEKQGNITAGNLPVAAVCH